MYKKSKILKLVRAELEKGSALGVAEVRAGLRSPDTLHQWRKRPLIGRYIAKCVARQEGVRIRIVEDALMRVAAEGNTTAMIFFLTNRAPDRWKDRRAMPTIFTNDPISSEEIEIVPNNNGHNKLKDKNRLIKFINN